MPSANVVYESMNEEYLSKVVSPLLANAGYVITSKHFSARNQGSMPSGSGAISIKSDDSELSPSQALDRVAELAHTLCEKLSEGVPAFTEGSFYARHARSYDIMGEYENANSAEETFIGVAMKLVTKSVDLEVRRSNHHLNSLRRKLNE